jgi:hypothetical protein
MEQAATAVVHFCSEYPEMGWQLAMAITLPPISGG